MGNRTPRYAKFKKRYPYAWAVYEVVEIDHLDTVTCSGFDPNEEVFAKAVRATDMTDEITLSITNNVVQINEASVDDYRVIIFVFGLMAP
jgi:hypothetical protein